MSVQISNDKIMTVWEWCSDAYIQQGIAINFPANTEPSKTYQWRYIKAIAVKFDEWGFDENTARQFIKVAVKHCKDIGVMRKGLAALHQSNLLQICYDNFQKQYENDNQSINSIENIHKWLVGRSNNDLLRALLYRYDPDELCNITKWYQSSKISRLYLSLSKSCGKAMARLAKSHPEERELLPKTTTLYMIRVEFLENENNVTLAKRIMKSDWRELCL